MNSNPSCSANPCQVLHPFQSSSGADLQVHERHPLDLGPPQHPYCILHSKSNSSETPDSFLPGLLARNVVSTEVLAKSSSRNSFPLKSLMLIVSASLVLHLVLDSWWVSRGRFLLVLQSKTAKISSVVQLSLPIQPFVATVHMDNPKQARSVHHQSPTRRTSCHPT